MAKVNRVDLKPDAIILGGRFLFSLKKYVLPSEMAKVCYVAQGFRDKDKPFVYHDPSRLHASSIQIILATAAYLLFRIFFTMLLKRSFNRTIEWREMFV